MGRGGGEPSEASAYADIFRSENRDAQVGFYSDLPVRDYWRAIGNRDGAKYKSWQQENDTLSDLAEHVDVVFPSLYTFYEDTAGWVRYAQANLAEARRTGNQSTLSSGRSTR